MNGQRGRLRRLGELVSERRRERERPIGSARSWPDLRLAGPALACWLAAILALRLDAGYGVLLAAAAALASMPALVVARRHRAGWVLLGVLLGVVCGATATAARVAVRDAKPLSAVAARHATVRAEVTVTDDPRPLRGSTGRPPAYAVPGELTRMTWQASGAVPAGSVTLSVRVLVLGADNGWRALLPGQRVIAVGRLGPARPGDLRAAVLSVPGAPRPIGEAPWVQRAAGRLRAGLQRACAALPREPGGLLPGLVVGDTSRLEPAVADDFTTTGMTHLLAVSGSNVAVVIGAVLLAARYSRAGPRLSALLCALALVGFVILARPSPSVLRAAVMGGIGLAALARGRPRSAVPALAGTVAALIIADPQLAVDPGFALSTMATAALLLIAPAWRDSLRRRGVPGGLAEALAIPAAAQVACSPVIAAISGTVGLAAVPANLLAIPAVAPATVLGVGAAIVSVPWPAGAHLLAWLAAWPARWLVVVARYGAEVPAGVVPWPAGLGGGLLLAGLLSAVLLACRRPVLRRLVAVVAAAVVVGAWPVRTVAAGWPPSGWLVVVCDVGQGDAVVLPVASGQAVVIDSGPEPAMTDRCLRRLGVRHVNLVVISHFHADHVGGLGGLFRARSVATLLTTGHPEPAAGRDGVLRAAAAYAVPVAVATTGVRYSLGDVQLSVIGPARPLTGTRSDPNNNSVVLLAQVRGHRVLLAGDAEQEEQRSLLAAVGGSGLRAEILKVAHHGSAYQDPEFLAAVDPLIALVSVGAGNPYGHPNASVLSQLTRAGVRVLRTDRDADVAAVWTGTRLAVAARGSGPVPDPP